MKIYSRFDKSNLDLSGVTAFSIEKDRVFRGRVIGFASIYIYIDEEEPEDGPNNGYPVFAVGYSTERSIGTGGEEFIGLDLEEAVLKVEELSGLTDIDKLAGFEEFYNAAFPDAEVEARK